MSHILRAALAASALAAGGAGFVVTTAPASAAGDASGNQAVLAGKLGYEGGAYPGKFHPTSGTVEVEFQNPPLVLEKHVGKSGHFRIQLSPGSYTVIGCGPSSSGGSSQCSQPQNVTLTAGEVDHITLIWAYVP